MRKLFTTLFALAALAVNAQYLPNSSFDSWKSVCGSTDAVSGMNQRPGVEPMDWNGSSVNQMGMKQQLVFNDGNAVKLQNKWVGMLGIGSVAPGYITLGTPWVYASMTLSDCDGGTYGGAQFNYRPDAVKGRFKRDDSNSENSYIVVYLWNGTYVSNIGKKSSPNQAKENVDRAILGKVSASSAGTLVAKCNYAFSSTGGGWQEIIVPLEYVSDNVPEMMNIVVCCGDYWERGNLTKETTLYADDIQFVYYSELESLVYDGKSLLEAGKNAYDVDAEYDENKLSLTSNGKGASIEKSFDNASKVLTITVKGNDYNADPSNVHTYTVTFAEGDGGEVVEPNPEPEPEPEPTPGDVDYTPAYTGTKTRDDRSIDKITLVSGNYFGDGRNECVVDNAGKDCYLDLTKDIEMIALAGETLLMNVDISGVWINAYLYIDGDANGFTAEIAAESNWKPAGDLVSYSFYNNGTSNDYSGWNSVGTVISGDARQYSSELPEFNAPAKAGLYRVRVKLDWCNIDPAGDRDGKFGDFMANGGQIVDFMLKVVTDETVEPEPDPEPEPEPTPGDVDYTPAYTGEKTSIHDRWINSIGIASDVFAGEAANVLSVDNSARVCYNDYCKEVVMRAAPGETVTLTMDIGEASWMNAYVYIDFDADGFTASIADGSNWKPAGDLVSYSFYNNNDSSDNSGWNSLGDAISGDSRSSVAVPAFAVPETAGLYRMRVKLDWCNIDPAGDRDGKFGDFMDNGGQIVDFMLEVGYPTGIENIVESMPEGIYDMMGREVDSINVPGIYIINGKRVLVK